jgi:hypothetical protein
MREMSWDLTSNPHYYIVLVYHYRIDGESSKRNGVRLN